MTPKLYYSYFTISLFLIKFLPLPKNHVTRFLTCFRSETETGMEANAELLALQRLDETCVHLQKQGNYLEALECMERGLVLRQHFFGSESDEV